VANVQRYALKSTNVYDTVLDHDPTSSGNVIQMDSPIATLVRCSGRLFLCIGEVIDILVDSRHTDQVAVEYLMEPSVFISYQMLFLVPASVEDDPDLKNDWRWSGKRGTSYRVAGCLIQPINPSISTKELGNPFYLFESGVLMAVGASILERLEQDHGISIPDVKKSDRFPYREAAGKYTRLLLVAQLTL
jgi:hypothetical protein